MSSCSDDAALTGPVALFLGVDTATWNIQQFVDAANWAKQHNISTLFVKVFEVGSHAGDSQGIWYGGINAWDAIYQEVQKVVNIVPYGFLYGDTYNNLTTEIATATQLLQKYGKLCLDMEGKYWNNSSSPTWATSIAQALQPLPGKLWLSCPANPSQSGDMPYIKALSPAVNIYMPMVYTNFLETTWMTDFIVQSQCIQPTIDLSQEFGPNDVAGIVASMKQAGVLALSCWYYGFAQQNPSLLDQIVSEFTKGDTMTIVKNSSGGIVDLVKSFQLEGGETQDACGPWSVAELLYAGLPGKGAQGTPEQVDQWADNEYTKYIGPNVTSDQNGSSIDNMHQFIKDAGLHWYDISAINPTSKQSDDMARLHTATDAGYPVLVTVNEQSVKRRDGSNPYPWQPALGPVNHIFTIVGHTNDGFLLVDDQLNNTDSWPDQYSEASIECHWACIVQLVGPDTNSPWLASIPGPDPLTWPANFNAQLFATSQATPPTGGTNLETIAQVVWNSTNTGAPTGTGIYKAWLADYENGKFHGPPLTKEYPNKNWSQKPVTAQNFAGGQYEWDGSPHYYSYS